MTADKFEREITVNVPKNATPAQEQAAIDAAADKATADYGEAEIDKMLKNFKL